MSDTIECTASSPPHALETGETPIFLTAAWRHLVVLNFEIDPDRLLHLLPRGTELDTYEGRSFVSMVGFQFLDTRLFGWPVPGHRRFEEVNLRFYVWREVSGQRRRGVVFVKELVPRLAVAKVARWFYNENYETRAMRHRLAPAAAGHRLPTEMIYEWRRAGRWDRLGVGVDPENWGYPAPGSLDEFIIEHYWGYSVQRDGGTMEYEVRHPAWRIAPAVEWEFDCDARALYGSTFAEALRQPPASAFLADGSAVDVHQGTRLRWPSFSSASSTRSARQRTM
ncbi:MAG: DUF2071 domain-containing protein [Pirellulales bacterium]|nr:DUF2071 domain-containing protein [Pirellulales bacterium]